MAEPIRVVVTGAAGQIAYSLLHQIATGRVFGPNQKVFLNLLDIEPMMEVLSGVVMELDDCALPLLAGVLPTADPELAFKDVAAAFLVGAMPRKQGMERKDLLSANVKIFKVQGNALDKMARKDVKVLVVGNPANTNALICSQYAPSIPKENFTAMTRLDHNRALGQLSAKIGTPVENIRNVIIWGNHSSTQYPDADHALVNVKGKETKVSSIVDKEYLQTVFLPTVQKRGAAVIAARKMSSALSAATAAADHMRDWWFGTPKDRWVSMGVVSDGSYGTPAGVVYSFPVTIANSKWSIVQGLSVSDFARKMLNATGQELIEERDEALSIIKD